MPKEFLHNHNLLRMNKLSAFSWRFEDSGGISRSWTWRLVQRPGLPSMHTRTLPHFHVSPLEHVWMGFQGEYYYVDENVKLALKLIGCLEELQEKHGWNSFWRRVVWSQNSLLQRNASTENERYTFHRFMMNEFLDGGKIGNERESRQISLLLCKWIPHLICECYSERSFMQAFRRVQM